MIDQAAVQAMAQLIEQQKHNFEAVRQKVGTWIAAQPPFVEVAAVTLAGAGQGESCCRFLACHALLGVMSRATAVSQCHLRVVRCPVADTNSCRCPVHRT